MTAARWLRCPRCGRVVAVAAGAAPSCPSCGAVAGPDVGQARARPVGRRRPPWAVGLLHFLTLGVGTLLWLLPTSREVDAYHGSSRSHRLAVAAALVGSPALVIALLAGNAQDLGLGWGRDVQQASEVLGFLGLATAACLTLATLCRIWWPVERSQRELGLRPDSATGLLLMTVLPVGVASLLSPLLGYLILWLVLRLAALDAGIVLFWFVLVSVASLPNVAIAVAIGRTQSGLNRLWAAAG